MPDNVFYKKSFLSVFQKDNVLLFMFKQKCVLNITMLVIPSTQQVINICSVTGFSDCLGVHSFTF